MNTEKFTDRQLFTPMTDGFIIIRRDEEGVVETNVPHLVVHHSPDGYEFGFGGSGPADLALNIVEHLLNRLSSNGEKVECFNGQCLRTAFRLHQDFKWQFIAPIDQDKGGVIDYKTALEWVKQQL